MIESEWESVDLYRLFQLFQRAMERFESDRDRVMHQVVTIPYTIEDQRTYILETIQEKSRASFDQVFGSMKNRLHAIVTFLALLELINNQRVSIHLGESRNSFWLEVASSSAPIAIGASVDKEVKVKAESEIKDEDAEE